MNSPLALIVDDEPDIRELLNITLQRMQINTKMAEDVSSAIEQLKQNHFDLCLVDMRLPDGDGIDIIKHISDHHPNTPVAMITAHGNIDSAVMALKAGAFDFVSKPVELPVLRRLVETALGLREVAKINPSPTDSHNTQVENDGILGKSAAINHIRQMIIKLARSQAPVLIGGESGTGKELAANLIHNASPRADKPFIAVNCGAIPSELMESEFFGHIKGSFTGAIKDKQGLFQASHGGTLFLDEVADLPLAMQVKLLRVIQEKKVRPIGATQENNIDIRLISASHKDINAMIEAGSFRQDLFYRIHVIELKMPPLRERCEDIPVMIDFLLKKISHSNQSKKPRVHRDALTVLYAYPFAGNVRELENILERACALCEEGIIQTEDLGIEAEQLSTTSTANSNLEDQLSKLEKKTILEALEATRWNKTAAAKKLGITFRALRYRLEKLDIDT